MYMFSDLMFMYMIASCAISLKREKYCESYKTQEYIFYVLCMLLFPHVVLNILIF